MPSVRADRRGQGLRQPRSKPGYKGVTSAKFIQDVTSAIDTYKKPVWVTEFAPQTVADSQASPDKYTQAEVDRFIAEAVEECSKRFAGTVETWNGNSRLCDCVCDLATCAALAKNPLKPGEAFCAEPHCVKASPTGCYYATQTCGDGIVDARPGYNEVCDATTGCKAGEKCNATCTACVAPPANSCLGHTVAETDKIAMGFAGIGYASAGDCRRCIASKCCESMWQCSADTDCVNCKPDITCPNYPFRACYLGTCKTECVGP